jgi:murein L,D-transpeptidase YafK
MRTLMASAAIAAALALGGCETDGTSLNGRALAPLSEKMIAEFERKDMPKESPILVRVFKEEAELEVWKQDASGKFALLKTYPICRWSGELGPKIKQGDRQAPEGFYTITPGQMNPNSQYYLAFNLGYPNAFDRAHGRTGAHLMVHGDCSSAGCYSMTDEQIQEVYALGRESFFGGQRSFQVQAYPFRMTALNMARHRSNPHMAFWKMIKVGYDHFEVTRLEPKVDVCDKRYVFNASAASPFEPAGHCPAYQVPQDIAAAVQDKQRRDEMQIADLIRRGTPAAPVKMGTDGGMHPSFLAKYEPRLVTDDKGNVRQVVEKRTAIAYTPGYPDAGIYAPVGEARAEPVTAQAAQSYRVASAQPNGREVTGSAPSANTASKPQSAGVLDRMTSTVSNWFGLRGSEPPAEQPKPATVRTATAAPAAPARPKAQGQPIVAAQAAAKPTAPAIQSASRQETAAAAPRQEAAAAEPQSSGTTAQASAPSASLMSGAQPIVPTNSFESRFGGLR